jgi:hypothetical protein
MIIGLTRLRGDTLLFSLADKASDLDRRALVYSIALLLNYNNHDFSR